MSEPPGDRVQELFDWAVALPGSQRAAFLEDACANEPDLRAEVESLLACDADSPEGTGDLGWLSAPGKVMHARLADCTVVVHENHRLTR